MNAKSVGQTKWPEYKVWASIKQRCTNPKNKDYKHYGGRGIRLCGRWHKFENFIADMGRRPPGRLEIDRKNNDGPYSKRNCRWATRIQNTNNRRGNIRISHNGLTLTARQWTRKLGLPKNQIISRIWLGWKPLDALLLPRYAQHKRAA